MDKKRILLVILFIVAVIGIGYGLYYFFWKKPPVPPPPLRPAINVAPPGVLPMAPAGPPPGVVPTLPPTAVTLPKASPIARGGLTQAPTLTTTLTLNPTISRDGKNLNYYNPSDGKFYWITPEGKAALLSNQTFYNIKNAIWSDQSDKAIIEYPDNSKILYNFTTQRQVTLPKHWEDFSFSRQGDQIAAKSIGLSPENRWLIVANPDGSEAKLIEPLGDNADKVQVSWSPAGGVIAFAATGESLGFGRKQIIPLGQNQENFKPLIVEGMGFEPKWSSQGDKLLYSAFNQDSDYNPTLWITNAQGEAMGTGRRKLNVATWAHKCSFANNETIYCAVPNKLERGTGFAPEIAQETPDSLYKIDLKTNLKSLVALPEGNYSMSNLVVSADQSILYFTDNATGQLHKIQLK